MTCLLFSFQALASKSEIWDSCRWLHRHIPMLAEAATSQAVETLMERYHVKDWRELVSATYCAAQCWSKRNNVLEILVERENGGGDVLHAILAKLPREEFEAAFKPISPCVTNPRIWSLAEQTLTLTSFTEILNGVSEEIRALVKQVKNQSSIWCCIT